MFGWQRIEHDKRYAMAGELFDMVNGLWQETENISYEGKVSSRRLENAWITPKPKYGLPVLVNATGSPAGFEFAVKYSDPIFITPPGGAHIDSALETLPDHITNINTAVKEAGRTTKTIINPNIISRDTSEERRPTLKLSSMGNRSRIARRLLVIPTRRHSTAMLMRGRDGKILATGKVLVWAAISRS